MTIIIITPTVGTVLLWMGELITKRTGNGISLLIFASILTGFPIGIAAWWNGGPMEAVLPADRTGDHRRDRLHQEASGGSRSVRERMVAAA